MKNVREVSGREHSRKVAQDSGPCYSAHAILPHWGFQKSRARFGSSYKESYIALGGYRRGSPSVETPKGNILRLSLPHQIQTTPM